MNVSSILALVSTISCKKCFFKLPNISLWAPTNHVLCLSAIFRLCRHLLASRGQTTTFFINATMIQEERCDEGQVASRKRRWLYGSGADCAQ